MRKTLRDRIGYVQEKKKTFLIPTLESSPDHGCDRNCDSSDLRIICWSVYCNNHCTSGSLLQHMGVSIVALGGITEEELFWHAQKEQPFVTIRATAEIYTKKRALDRIDMYNKNTWLNNQSVGDKIMVFGREYPIGEDGHIHVPTEDFWTSGRCNYGKAI